MTLSWNLKQTKAENLKSRLFKIAVSMEKIQKIIYQGFTIWFYRNVTLKKKILESYYHKCNT